MQINLSNWQEVELGKVARFINGRAFKPEEWENDGKLIIRIQDLTGSINNPNYTTKEFDKKYLVRKGDLLISWSATLDAFLWDKEEGWLNQHIFKVEEDRKLLDHKYLYYFVKKSIDLFKKNTHGSTMKHITKGDFDKIKIPLPPIETQKKIVAILEKAEALKQKRELADKLTQEYLKSVFYEMFLKNRNQFGSIKGADLFELAYGKGLSEEERDDGEYPVYGSNGKVGSHSTFLVKSPGIVVGRKGSIGEVNFVKEDFWPIDTTYYIKPIKKSNFWYLYYLLKSHNLKLNKSAAIPGLNRNDVYSIKFVDTPIELQNKFASIVEHVEKMKEKQLKNKDYIGEMFNSLMQKAFNGELIR